jgi:hypothetical protein
LYQAARDFIQNLMLDRAMNLLKSAGDSFHFACLQRQAK